MRRSKLREFAAAFSKLDFSKQIFFFVSVAVTIVTLYSMALMWYTRDTSPLAYLIPAWFAEFATATGFYYWKAKNENMQKYGWTKNREDEQ